MRCDATSHTMTGFSSREVNVAIAVRSILDVKDVPRRLAERACCTNSERTHYSYWNRQVSVGFCGTACDYVRKRCKLLQRRADDTHTHSLFFSREIFSQSLAFWLKIFLSDLRIFLCRRQLVFSGSSCYPKISDILSI